MHDTNAKRSRGTERTNERGGDDAVSRRTVLRAVAAGATTMALQVGGAAAQSAAVPVSDKRGYIGTDSRRARAIGAGWWYNYSVSTSNRDAFDEASFVPMITGDDLWWTSGASDRILSTSPRPNYVLGYNEPEHEEVYTDVQTILEPHWRTLSEKFAGTDVTVVSPSIKTGTSDGRAYLDAFMSAVESDDGLTVDELAIHWYAGAAGMRSDPETRTQWFLDRLQSIHDTYGLPLWITEFGGPNFDDGDAQALADANITFLERVIPELESRSYVKRYAWWEGGPATRLTEIVDGSAQLTDVGAAYVGQSAGSGPSRLTSLPTSQTVDPGTYQLVNVNSGLVLGVTSGSTSDGADVVQQSDTDGGHQQWTLRYDANGQYELIATHSGSVADVKDAAEENGATVQQWAANDGTHQRWYVESIGNGEYRIVAAHSGLVLDVSDASTADGQTVIQWQWNGGDNQRWRLEPVEDRTGPPAVAGTTPQDPDGDGLYEDLNGNGRLDSDDVVVFFEHTGDAAVTDHTAAYDFNGNGRIDFDDVASLFDGV